MRSEESGGKAAAGSTGAKGTDAATVGPGDGPVKGVPAVEAPDARDAGAWAAGPVTAGILARARREGRSYLMEHESKEILAAAGIATTGALVAGSADEAVELARTVGYPVVLKILSPDVVHKSDTGGVRLNLADAEAVRAAYDGIVAAYRFRHIAGVSVQPMASPGVEAIVGVVRDPNFGPVLMFGLGGIFVEVLKDVTFRVLPVTARDVEAMIGEIKGYPVLAGRRGKAVDLAALRELLLRVADLVAACPEIAEIDLNPVFLYDSGLIVVDARLILGAALPLSEPSPLQDHDGSAAGPSASAATAVSAALPDVVTQPVDPSGQRRSDTASDLHDFFYPRSIAVLGASDVPGKLGYNVLKNLLSHGFAGRLYPINPRHPEVQGLKAYRHIGEVPEPVDLAIVIVPAETALEAIESCCRSGVRFIVVESAGFAETGEAGRAVQARIRQIVQQRGCRILGPNCSGVINTHHRMVQSIGPVAELGAGNIGLIAQAGVYAAGILTGLRQVMDFGIVATIGNKMDIDETDILEFLGHDEHINVIALYMEDVRSGRRFIDVARAVTAKKPVIVLKSGRTEAGGKAAASHTASLAGNDAVNDAAFRQAGVIRVRDNEHFFGLTKAFAKQPLPEGDGVLVVTYTGSLGVAATDALYFNGLRLAELEAPLKARLQRILPGYVKALNPVDYSFSMDPDQVRETLAIGLESTDVSAFIVVIQGEILGDFIEVLRGVGGQGKPVLACVACKEFMMTDVIPMERAGIPIYSTVEMAVEALAALRRYRTIGDSH